MSFFKSTFFPHTYAATVQTPQVTNNHHNAVMAAHPCGVPKKRFAKMCSLHPLDAVQGVGISQQAFCSAKVAVAYTAALLASTMRPLKTPPKFDNHFARMIVRFQAQPEADGCFSARKSSELAFHCKQNELSNPLSFYQSSPCVFLQTAESGVFSKLFVDTARFLW